MENVIIYGSLESHDEKLAELEHMYFTISLMDLIQEKYNINSIYLEEGFINLFVNKKGENNYTFLKEASKSESDIHFDFENIVFKNTQINYENQKINQNHRIFAHQLKGELSVINSITDVSLNANCHIEYIKVNNNKFLSAKKLTLQGALKVNTDSKMVNLSSVKFLLASSTFNTKGWFNYGSDSYDLQVNGEKTDFTTLLSLLPNNVSNGFEKYNSTGNASFATTIKKEKGDKNPSININFGCSNVSLVEPSTGKTLQNLSFKGDFTNGTSRNSKTSQIKFDDLSGSFDGHDFKAKLDYQNFDNPYINGYLKGEFPAAFFMQFSDSNNLSNITGTADVDLKLKAFQKDLEAGNHEAITSSGQVVLSDINFDNEDGFYRFKNLNGSFLFNKDDIAISDFEGNINNSDFKINGYLKGFFSHFFSRKEKLIVLADLESNHLDFDQLIESNHAEDQKNVAVDNSYLKDIQFNLNANAKVFKWGKLNIKNASGNIRHNNLIFVSDNLKGTIGDGNFNLNGTLDSRKTNDIKLSINTHVEGIQIDSIFYYFNDFNEDFITHKNLKGKVFVNLKATMSFDEYLNLKSKSLIADVDIKATNGELNNFEPMQNLSKFLGEDALRNIHFSEISNVIHIENEKIEIPDMRINSSVSNINLRGSHTFDHKIYYKLKVPLKNLKASKKKEAESAYESTKDGLIVHLIISGTTDDFTIAYDTKATTKIIKDKVKEEVRDIRDIIKGTFQKDDDEEQIELDEEDFFEFEEDSIQ